MGDVRICRLLLARSMSQSCSFRRHPPAASSGVPLPFTPYLQWTEASSDHCP